MSVDPDPAQQRNLNRVIVVTVWRESVPSDPTQFNPKQQGLSTVVVSDLKCEFKIRHDLRRNPNSAWVKIYNAAPDTRAFFDSKPLVASVAAGYVDAGGPRHLITGDVTFSMSTLHRPNWETILEIGDGTCNNAWARVNRSYAPGTTLLQILKDTAQSFGYTVPNNVLQNPLFRQKLPGGAHFHGPAADELSRFLQPFELSHSIQNGVLTILADNEASPGSVWPIDVRHGMLETPYFGTPPRSGKPPHVRIKNEIYPELTAGGQVNVTSVNLNGLHRIEAVEHRGTNLAGDEFVSEIEVSPMTATG